MSFVNVGATYLRGFLDIPTKKALKDAFKTDPANVVLYTTSLFSADTTHNGSELDVGTKYSVVGPNPYNSRKWYATVEKLPNGTIRVS